VNAVFHPSSTDGRIAVIVPCFNDGGTVEDTVASVKAARESIELVVVDDGSTDEGTLAAFERLEGQGVRVVHQANTGLAGARNTGLAATTAPYVYPLDADDVLVPGALDRLAAALDADRHAVVAWGDFEVFGDTSFVQRSAPSLDPWLLSHIDLIPVASLLRRGTLEAVGGWQPRAPGYEDWDLWLTLAERGWDGIYVPGVVFRYRRHGIRMGQQSAGRHGELEEILRLHHAELYARRSELWRRSDAPLAIRVGLPVLSHWPGANAARRSALKFVLANRVFARRRATT
jgi:glycosyltransferase involved in cell wall biosynthesis